MRSLYLNDLISSIAFFKATNSDPQILDSTVLCFLQCQTTGAWLRNINPRLTPSFDDISS
jgi:hypothetical protein